jgi:hypothetical protein
MIYEHAQLIRALRDFSETMPEGDSRVDPMIETMSGLARRAAEAIEHLDTLADLLRDDLDYFAETCERCEGCNAPLKDEDPVSSVQDVRGCWGYVSDDKKALCWRYRTKQGMERAWPECAVLKPPASK